MSEAPPSIAILRPGTFTDVRGTKVTFSRRDLEDVAASYDATSDPAPIVIGHPASNAPAHGWIGKVELIGDVLRAQPSTVAPAFAQAVAAGRYRKVSPQLYQPRSPGNPKPGRWYLQHVGFLGGAAPAIKGLGTVTFAQDPLRGTVAITLDRLAHVSFAAPAGYRVDDRHAAAHARARELQAADPRLTFWDAFTQARAETA